MFHTKRTIHEFIVADETLTKLVGDEFVRLWWIATEPKHKTIPGMRIPYQRVCLLQSNCMIISKKV
jgi:hypothetical protein